MPGTISTGGPVVNNGAGATGVGTICSNCWAVPRGTGRAFNGTLNNGVGPTAASSAATLDWAAFSANAANRGTNEIDPLKQGYELAAQQKNTWVATLDQRLLPGVSLWATGFDSNRRVSNLVTPDYSSGASNDIKTFAVPTTNPYYPTNAPNNLRVSYDLAFEKPIREPAFEISYRYAVGLNLDLPFTWSGNVYYSHSYDTNQYLLNNVNDNAVSAALGWSVGGVTKPAAVP